MKQYITEEQYLALSESAKKTLWFWALDKHQKSKEKYFIPIMNEKIGMADKIYPLLSIGQMIEFLANNGGIPIEIGSNNVSVRNIIRTIGGEFNHINTLCDALWEAVKEVLEKGEEV